MEKQLIGVETCYGPEIGYEVRLTWKLPKKVRVLHPLTGKRNSADELNPMTDIEVGVFPVADGEEAARLAAEWSDKLKAAL